MLAAEQDTTVWLTDRVFTPGQYDLRADVMLRRSLRPEAEARFLEFQEPGPGQSRDNFLRTLQPSVTRLAHGGHREPMGTCSE